MLKCQEKIFPGFKENHENLKRVNDLVPISVFDANYCKKQKSYVSIQKSLISVKDDYPLNLGKIQ